MGLELNLTCQFMDRFPLSLPITDGGYYSSDTVTFYQFALSNCSKVQLTAPAALIAVDVSRPLPTDTHSVFVLPPVGQKVVAPVFYDFSALVSRS